MTKAVASQTQFTAGELDPRLAARHDYDGYYKGAQTLTNVICLGQGGVKRRPGMKYIDTIGHSKARLVTFEFNVTQTYLLVFADSKMYVYMDGVKVTNLNGTGVNYIDTDYTEAELPELTWTQSADTLIVCHNNHSPRKIMRGTSHNLWTNTLLSFAYQPTFDFNRDYDSDTFTIGADWDSIGSTVTVTCDSSTTITSDHVGGMFEGNGGIIRIESVTTTTLTGALLQEFVNQNDVSGIDASIEEPVWSAAHGYPGVVTFHESRLWFSNSTARPQTLWGSVIGDFFNFDRGVAADDEAIDITLDTDQVNAVYHIVSGRHLQIFTSGGEFYVPDRPIKPKGVSVLRQTRFGVLKGVRPISVDGATMFIQRNGKQVREYLYGFAEQSYNSTEVNLLAPHLTNSPVAMAGLSGDVENEGNYLFVVNGDGTMGVFITNRAEVVTAWTKFTTNGLIKDVAVVEDVVYLYVNRIINGVSVYHIEALDNNYYTDAAVQVTATPGSSTTSFAGLAHLNGEECRVLGDGVVKANGTPAGGLLSVEGSITTAEVGLNFNTEVKTMPVNITLQSGPINSKKRRILKVSAQLHKSSGVKVNGRALPERTFGNGLGESVTPFTGIKTIPMLGYSKTTQVTVTQTDPLPMTLLGLTLEVQVTG